MRPDCSRCKKEKSSIFDYVKQTVFERVELNLCPACCKWALIKVLTQQPKLFETFIEGRIGHRLG